MATIAEQLTSLANTKTAIKQAIVDKGVQVADDTPFSGYAAKIGEISGGGGSSEEWQPNPNWWDIRKILDEDTRDYAGKVGVILYGLDGVSDFALLSSGVTAVATSDGAFYTYADNGANVSHNWDTTQDKDDGHGLKTRWVIYYYTTDTTSDAFLQSNAKFGWAYNYIAYLVLRINCSRAANFCSGQKLLEGIDNEGFTLTGTDFSGFCKDCYNLQKLPDVLDASSCTNFYTFCQNCYILQNLPDTLDTSKGTNFGFFCECCYNLQNLPDALDTSSGTNFNSFCGSCYNLQKLPDTLDTSSGTNFSSFCVNCKSLIKLPDGLNTGNGTNFYAFCNGCTKLQKLPEKLNTSKGENFNNFCYYCSGLLELPDGLDTSSGTNFSNFLQGCANLKRLPDTLDTSSGTNFNSFCNSCKSLIKLPDRLNTGNGTSFSSFFGSSSAICVFSEISMAANTTVITSKYSAPFNGATWVVELPLTLPSNMNFWLDMSTRISIESFRYIADHAPDVTATPRTLTVGSTNISRINAADPTIITDLNAKGWTVA